MLHLYVLFHPHTLFIFPVSAAVNKLIFIFIVIIFNIINTTEETLHTYCIDTLTV